MVVLDELGLDPELGHDVATVGLHKEAPLVAVEGRRQEYGSV